MIVHSEVFVSSLSITFKKDVPTMKGRKKQLSISIVLLFGILLFWVGTDGFTAFTEETARTQELISTKPILPQVTLEDSYEEQYSFDVFKDKYVLMTFFYTACTTVCPILEKNVADVIDTLPEKYIGEDIMFLSISFDTERDTPDVLQQYGKYLNVNYDEWRMARVPDQDELDKLLRELGVIAIPDGEGDYQHNVAFYLIDRSGTLIDVLDYEDIDGATERIIEVIEEEEGV